MPRKKHIESGMLIDGIDANHQLLGSISDESLQRSAKFRIGRAHKKSLAQRYPDAFPSDMFAAAGSWKSDDIAINALAGRVGRSDAITFSRLAILRARDRARGRLALERGWHECIARIRRGDHHDNFSSVVEFARDGDAATPHDLHRRMVVERTAQRLGLSLSGDDTDSEAFRRVARGKKGDKSLRGLHDFVEALAGWWWRNTGRVPEKSRGLPGHSKNQRAPSFIDYVTAAYADATGIAAPNITRSVTTILQAFENGDVPWLTQNP